MVGYGYSRDGTFFDQWIKLRYHGAIQYVGDRVLHKNQWLSAPGFVKVLWVDTINKIEYTDIYGNNR